MREALAHVRDKHEKQTMLRHAFAMGFLLTPLMPHRSGREAWKESKQGLQNYTCETTISLSMSASFCSVQCHNVLVSCFVDM